MTLTLGLICYDIALLDHEALDPSFPPQTAVHYHQYYVYITRVNNLVNIIVCTFVYIALVSKLVDVFG